MLARLARQLPAGDYLYEPKWDGFRALVFRDGADVELVSRRGRPLGRYFPEVAAALKAVECAAFAVDGELLVPAEDGFDFSALLARLHPAASRVARLAAETPATLVLFDALAVDGDDLRPLPFAERRRRLEHLVQDNDQVLVTPVTDDQAVARLWLERPRSGVDGVVAKHRELTYQSGVRAMIKVKRERTIDCVVAGFRTLAGRPALSSLLLGLYDRSGALVHVGVASSFDEGSRLELMAALWPFRSELVGHPWAAGFGEPGPLGRLPGAASTWHPSHGADWIPVRPELVAEVVYDHIDDGRLRHPARFRRWRPDRDPASCTFEQLADPAAA
jgi:ATP-dependent DNA ligase